MSQILIAAVGDILVDRPEPDTALRSIAPILAEADIAVGNFEGVLTDRCSAMPGAATATVVPARNARALRGFDVMSLANNHAMDSGYDGLRDTLAQLAAQQVVPIGVGETVDDAWAPTLVEGPRGVVAFLAFTSVLRVGTEAREGLPGVAAIRAQDHYAPRFPGDYGPGVPPKVLSVVNDEDWDRALRAIGDARDRADGVVVSAHWGDFSRPWVLTDHERRTAEGLLEAGADLILGHHHHFLRGLELKADGVVFYGLGHIVFDQPRYPEELRLKGIDLDGLTTSQLVSLRGEYGIYPRADSPNFPFHPLARRTAIALARLDTQTRAVTAGLIPCLIDERGDPQPVRSTDRDWDEALSVVRQTLCNAALPAEIDDDASWTLAGYDVVTFMPTEVGSSPDRGDADQSR